MKEVVEGVFHWKALHPRIGIEVGCHYVAGSKTAVDPLVPEEGVEWFDDRGVERIVLSNRHHLRHAPQLAQRFGCQILCHEAGLHEFEDGPDVYGFAFGERLADDLVALEMGAICAEDTALHVEAGEGALLFADGLINHDGIGFVSDRLIGDDPEAVKRRTRERCRALLDERFDHLLFAHGDPIVGGGHETLRAVAEGG